MYKELRKLAGSCEHVAGDNGVHRFAVFNLAGLNAEGVLVDAVRVGKYGIVCRAGADVHAVLNNVLWDDEHCAVCCGALLKFVQAFDQGTLLRCGPTIAPTLVPGRSITDEYWTD